jgi:hypothetical protein
MLCSIKCNLWYRIAEILELNVNQRIIKRMVGWIEASIVVEGKNFIIF